MNGSDDALRPIVLAGPTGSGKSNLAQHLAHEVKGAIICADSRQVFSRMRIGSAGPSLADEEQVLHLGYHEISPLKDFAAGDFLRITDENIQKAQQKGLRPILVGGTGMYLRSWRFGLDDVPRADPQLRAKLRIELETVGAKKMHARLAEVDPVTAKKVEPTDPVRIVRGLEVFAMTGKPASALRNSHLKGAPRQAANFFLLNPERTWLLPRIEKRVQQMYAGGLIEEAVALRTYLDKNHRLLGTMGYEEALLLFDEKISEQEAQEKTFIRHRQYARRQRTWFKKEPWWTSFILEAEKDIDIVLAEILAQLQ